MTAGAKAVALAIVLVVIGAAERAVAKRPVVRTAIIDRYPFEPRAPGDGAPIVQVPDEVAEPLFLFLTDERFTVWWRARHSCDKALRAVARVQGEHLTLDVETKPKPRPTDGCGARATVFETVVEGWGQGPREVKSEGATGDIASLWVSSPSPSRPKEIATLVDRVRERGALRRLGERIAWRYHVEGESRAAIAAYRWLVGLDELHWRNTLYHARIFHNAAFTRTKGGALAALESLLPGVERMRARVAAGGPSDAELTEVKQELAALEAFLEPALRYLALKWHGEALHRWQAALRAYRAYLRLFPTTAHAPALRFFYASALLHNDEPLEARAQLRLAATALPDEERRKLAAACATALALDDISRADLAPCRAPRPDTPRFSLFPKAADERFARPLAMQE